MKKYVLYINNLPNMALDFTVFLSSLALSFPLSPRTLTYTNTHLKIIEKLGSWGLSQLSI